MATNKVSGKRLWDVTEDWRLVFPSFMTGWWGERNFEVVCSGIYDTSKSLKTACLEFAKLISDSMYLSRTFLAFILLAVTNFYISQSRRASEGSCQIRNILHNAERGIPCREIDCPVVIFRRLKLTYMSDCSLLKWRFDGDIALIGVDLQREIHRDNHIVHPM